MNKTKILYLQCSMGAAGDMLTAALFELLSDEDKQKFIKYINSVGIKNVEICAEPSIKCGITGTHISVKVDGLEEHSHDVHKHHSHERNHRRRHRHANDHEHSHSHSGIKDIQKFINSLGISEKVKSDSLAIYKIIAEAEAKVHGEPIENIHFHEVGTADAVADILGACILIEQLAPEYIVTSPIHVGSGSVRCSHGILPVPAPATAHILQGKPVYSGKIKGELCTPTGAAILSYFTNKFGEMPVMTINAIGYGMGTKNFEMANCVRAFMGETESTNFAPNGEIAELKCNIDDMTGEEMGFVLKLLIEKGAVDVFTIPVQMKKNRPAYVLVCLCKPKDADYFVSLMLKHTTTFGVRKNITQRYILDRTFTEKETKYGKIRIKKGIGYNVEKEKYEYEDLAKISKEKDISIISLKREIEKIRE